MKLPIDCLRFGIANAAYGALITYFTSNNPQKGLLLGASFGVGSAVANWGCRQVRQQVDKLFGGEVFSRAINALSFCSGLAAGAGTLWFAQGKRLSLESSAIFGFGLLGVHEVIKILGAQIPKRPEFDPAKPSERNGSKFSLQIG